MASSWDQDRRLEARWRRMVREFADSRLGVREFCRVNGVKVSSLHFWREEFRRRDCRQLCEGVSASSRRVGGRRANLLAVTPPASPTFVSVRVVEAVGTSVAPPASPTFVSVRVMEAAGGDSGVVEADVAEASPAVPAFVSAWVSESVGGGDGEAGWVNPLDGVVPDESVAGMEVRGDGRVVDGIAVVGGAVTAKRVDKSVVVGERMDGPSGGADGRMEIVLAGGRRVVLSGSVDRQVLADVVSVLEGLPVASSEREVSSC